MLKNDFVPNFEGEVDQTKLEKEIRHFLSRLADADRHLKIILLKPKSMSISDGIDEHANKSLLT